MTDTYSPERPIDSELLLSGLLQTLRSTLSACAEIAGQETLTASVVTKFLEAYQPDALHTEIAGHGLAAVYNGHATGPTVLIRSELDGLPTQRSTDQSHEMLGGDAAHRCGHDGHMTMVAGLAPLLMQERPSFGRVILLFQPAEETGEGALKMLGDSRLRNLAPDAAIALHNIPGSASQTVLYRRGSFASASVGIRIELTGLAAHAAEPEHAKSPAKTLATLLNTLPDFSAPGATDDTLLTITHARLGHESFGITPGTACIFATLRASKQSVLQNLRKAVEAHVRQQASHADLDVDIQWLDDFPETRSDTHLVDALITSCQRASVPVQEITSPFRWSEDFGHFSALCPTLYFGLGAGQGTPHLHHPDYDFPDDILETGLTVFHSLIRTLTNQPTLY